MRRERWNLHPGRVTAARIVRHMLPERPERLDSTDSTSTDSDRAAEFRRALRVRTEFGAPRHITTVTVTGAVRCTADGGAYNLCHTRT